MDLLFATYLTLFDPAATDKMAPMIGYYHTPALSGAAPAGTCDTAWGKHFRIGETLVVDSVTFECQYMSTWYNGKHVGNSARWHLSSVVH